MIDARIGGNGWDAIAPTAREVHDYGGGGGGGSWAAVTSSTSAPEPPPAWATTTAPVVGTAPECTDCQAKIAPPSAPSPDIAVVVGTRDWLLWVILIVIAAFLLYWLGSK